MGVQGGPWGFLFIGRRSNIGVRARAGNHGEIPGRELRCAGKTELPRGAHGSAAGSACGPGVREGLTSGSARSVGARRARCGRARRQVGQGVGGSGHERVGEAGRWAAARGEGERGLGCLRAGFWAGEVALLGQARGGEGEGWPGRSWVLWAGFWVLAGFPFLNLLFFYF